METVGDATFSKSFTPFHFEFPSIQVFQKFLILFLDAWGIPTQSNCYRFHQSFLFDIKPCNAFKLVKSGAFDKVFVVTVNDGKALIASDRKGVN